LGAIYRTILALRRRFYPESLRTAYRVIYGRGGWILAIVREGTDGETPQPTYGTFADREEAQKKADELNAKAGLTKRQVRRIV
jgi:hypothetical protein